MATLVPQSKFKQARIGLGQWFELKAREGLNDGTTESRKQLLDEIELEALRLYQLHESPIWQGLALCHRAGEDGGEEWVERIETEEKVPWYVWSEKRDYETNLDGLLQKLAARKRYWLGRYDRKTPDQAAAKAVLVTEPVAGLGKVQSEQQTELNVADQRIAMNHNAAPYPKRAAWFQEELALRQWSVHDLQAQGGPDWKTSRKILDGLSVSRGVIEKTASALSKKRRQLLFRDIPQE